MDERTIGGLVTGAILAMMGVWIWDISEVVLRVPWSDIPVDATTVGLALTSIALIRSVVSSRSQGRLAKTHAAQLQKQISELIAGQAEQRVAAERLRDDQRRYYEALSDTGPELPLPPDTDAAPGLPVPGSAAWAQRVTAMWDFPNLPQWSADRVDAAIKRLEDHDLVALSRPIAGLTTSTLYAESVAERAELIQAFTPVQREWLLRLREAGGESEVRFGIESSEAMRGLDARGLVRRQGRRVRLTSEGEREAVRLYDSGI